MVVLNFYIKVQQISGAQAHGGGSSQRMWKNGNQPVFSFTINFF